MRQRMQDWWRLELGLLGDLPVDTLVTREALDVAEDPALAVNCPFEPVGQACIGRR
jgi:hypothetical protein